MKLTQKQKLEQFDAISSKLEMMTLVAFDLTCNSRFKFGETVSVDAGNEIDGDYPDHVYRVSVSRRAMPVYMVETMGYDGNVECVNFHSESDCIDHQTINTIYWRAIRHAQWKQRLARTNAA